MLSARAYSFRQKSRLAISLSWIGGYINVIVFLACGAYVANMTGNATALARTAAQRVPSEELVYGLLVAMFLAGAVVSSVMMEAARRCGSRSKYLVPLASEAILLCVLAVGLRTSASTSTGLPRLELLALATFLMGIQNATITKISGAVVRSTHMTGVITDLGIEGVQFAWWSFDQLRGRSWRRAGRVMRVSQRHPSMLRLLLLASVLGSFVLGALVGAILYRRFSYAALLAPTAFLVLIVIHDLRKPIADIRELDLLRDPELRLEDFITRILKPHIVVYRGTFVGRAVPHRAPDFQLWLSRVPGEARIVILALSPLTRFDANAVLDLEQVVKKLHESHKKLILSGTTAKQFRVLEQLGVARMMDIENIIPDLELAIARAIFLLQAERPALRFDPVAVEPRRAKWEDLKVSAA